jgi:hypothetical protein
MKLQDMVGYAFSPVRENANNLRFVTMVDLSTMKAENLYFAKTVAERGEIPEVGAKIDLSGWKLTETKNAAGELRMKLTNRLESGVETLVTRGYQLA